MHALTEFNDPGENFVGGVRFTMMDGPARIICWITPEALDGIEGGTLSQQDRMECFVRHRLKIEGLARKKYSAGEQSPILMTFDLTEQR